MCPSADASYHYERKVFKTIVGIEQLQWPRANFEHCGQSYKQFTLVFYESRVVIWSIFKSCLTLES